MSVRVVARVRPLLKTEVERDQIVSIAEGADGKPTVVKIPNPKNQSEEFTFQFNSVYGSESTQQQIFEAEVTPTVKHLFQGYDVTIFAYGSTGTGKTHTMRGGKSLAERGMIPRLLSSIYRKSRAIEKSSENETNVEVSMSYYEIYNDRVYDLFETPEKRTPTGLPIREAEGGKTVVVGLSELPCANLKDFEILYDRANANRSTGATKLNAHSSRSHAVLCVKVTITSPTETRVSTASAIDLAGSEDNRRTGNGKDRMVESASINKSLFVLAQCVEAISKKQHRIPYRESKMTRILSLGQNNGFTVMILNLAPVKAFHLDTLSSLNFANRTKKIEVREVENEPIFRGPPRPNTNAAAANAQRRPLQPLTNNINVNLTHTRDAKTSKPLKEFAVWSDKSKHGTHGTSRSVALPLKSSPLKRSADGTLLSSRPSKQSRSTTTTVTATTAVAASLSSLHRRVALTTKYASNQHDLENLIERKVSQILAEKALAAPAPAPASQNHPTVSAEVQARLDSIEKRLEGQDGERAEGLSYLFMAKQHQARGEEFSALKMYELARPFFPGNEKLENKIDRLRQKIENRRRKEKTMEEDEDEIAISSVKEGRNGVYNQTATQDLIRGPKRAITKQPRKVYRKQSKEEDDDDDDDEYQKDGHSDDEEYKDSVDNEDDDDDTDNTNSNDSDCSHKRRYCIKKSKPQPSTNKSRSKRKPSQPNQQTHDHIPAHTLPHIYDDDDFQSHFSASEHKATPELTPRTRHILSLLNTGNPAQIQRLPGIGAKKADLITESLSRTRRHGKQNEWNNDDDDDDDTTKLKSWNDVLTLDVKGMGIRGWNGIRDGVNITSTLIHI